MIEYNKIKEVNDEIKKKKIGEKDYAEVSERVLAFRKLYPNGKIITEIVDKADDSITMKATVYDEGNNILSSGYAGEVKKGPVNTISMIENCETSAIGRALGFCGLGIDNGIASNQDMQKVKEFEMQNKREEIYNKMYLSEKDAINIVKTSIAELMRKQGVIKEELERIVSIELWTSIEDMNLQQLKRLEGKLQKINNATDTWNKLYNKNSKIKTVVPMNQEVIYQSSLYKYGQLAIKQAKEDEILRNDIIEAYLDLGVDLTKTIE